MDWVYKHAASDKAGSYYKQQEFEEGQDLEDAAIEGFLKPYEAFTKDCQGSDVEIEVWEFQEINGEQVRDES